MFLDAGLLADLRAKDGSTTPSFGDYGWKNGGGRDASCAGSKSEYRRQSWTHSPIGIYSLNCCSPPGKHPFSKRTCSASSRRESARRLRFHTGDAFNSRLRERRPRDGQIPCAARRKCQSNGWNDDTNKRCRSKWKLNVLSFLLLSGATPNVIDAQMAQDADHPEMAHLLREADPANQFLKRAQTLEAEYNRIAQGLAAYVQNAQQTGVVDRQKLAEYQARLEELKKEMEGLLGGSQ
jgi:hypothetical protein